jgi:tRNA(fMet)-specific endonuclease VapC
MTNSGADVYPSRLTLDTTAYSHLRRGDAKTVGVVADADVVLIPAVVLGELEAGFRIGARYLENRRVLEEFLREPYVNVIDTTVDVARRYGEVFAELKRAGTPIPVNDIWIAATTLSSGTHLITFDTDFQRIPGLPHTVLAA